MEYKGVVSGIGDRQSDANVIFPKFDAKLNNFIIGQDTILDGFVLQGSTLTGGACVAKGYRGVYDSDITLSSTEKYVYGKFVIYDDPNIIDEFYIVTSSTALSYTNADILHTIGEYYFPLVENGKQLGPVCVSEINTGIKMSAASGYFYGKTNIKFSLGKIIKVSVYADNDNFELNLPSNIIELTETHTSNNISISVKVYSSDFYFDLRVIVEYEDISSKSREYPKNAGHAVVSDVVSENGVLKNGVTAETQEVGDNSDKVATTAFVQNQIIEMIGYEGKNINNTIDVEGGWNTQLTIYHKANYCIIPQITITGGLTTEWRQGYVLSNIPLKFRPQSDVNVICMLKGYRNVNLAFGATLTIKKNGDIVTGEFEMPSGEQYCTNAYGYNIGYETN